MKALAGSGVPVPNVLYLSGEDTPIGRMFYVMAFLDGRIFWDPALPEILDNAGRAAIYDAMNATLAALARSSMSNASASPISASRAIISNASSAAGPASTAPPRPGPFADMERLIAWLDRQHAGR